MIGKFIGELYYFASNMNNVPTIAYGSIVQMFVVKMTFDYTLGVPLNILPGLAGDFDQLRSPLYSDIELNYLNELLEVSTKVA
jgi:hypothetical protein